MSNIEHVPEGTDLEGLTRDEVSELTVSESDMESAYAETLDEVYGTVSIAGYEYETSRALEEIDPIAYRVGYSDYVSNYFEEIDLDNFPTELADEEE